MDGIRRSAGIDWAKERHAVCIIDERGGVLARFEVEHSEAGLRELVSRLGGVEGVAIERPDGPVVAALLEAGLPVVVIASRHVKALRTDGHRLRPLRPDTPETLALRAAVRARKDLVGHRTALAAQLAAHLSLAFPGAVDLFDELASPIARAFLTRFPSPERAAWLGPTRFEHWLRAQGYSGRRTGAELHARLVAAPRGMSGESAAALAGVTLALVAALAALDEQVKVLEARIAGQLAGHPDAGIFTSLPRAGRVRAAALLAEIGDRRERFPTAESLACLSGATPSTRQSGQHRAVSFRYTCDKKLREALVDFAQDSRRSNVWAEDLYRRARERGKSHPHAVRILARAWVPVIWRCWQDRVPYDPARHGALQRLVLAPTAVAA